jgi:poly(3-hydroxybutyrate) depolymerase
MAYLDCRRGRRAAWLALAVVPVLLAAGAGGPADDANRPDRAIPTGSAKQEVDVGNARLEVFTYKPRDYKKGPLLVVIHGLTRNAESYRNSAIELAEGIGALVVAPRLDAERFPTTLFQRGGLLTPEGKVAPRKQWTWQVVPKLVEAVRRQEGRPDMPYYLLGHSGGGQFLVRLAGFLPTEARRIVAANPGSHLFPTRDLPYPYGFGELPKELSDDQALKHYLAQPLTLYLGTADTQKTENLDMSETANKQGPTRYQRGLNAFRAAEQLAKRNGWEFRWRLVEAAGVGHSAKKMFDNPQCARALADK